MLLRVSLLEEEERKDALEIWKIQNAIMRGEIKEQDWWDRIEEIQWRTQTRFAILMDWRALESYKTYKNELPSWTP